MKRIAVGLSVFMGALGLWLGFALHQVSDAQTGGGFPPPVPAIVVCVGGPCNAQNIKVGQTYIVYKVNNTSISSSTTVTADPDLQFTNVPNGQYMLDAYLYVDLVTTATQGFSWGVVTGAAAPAAQANCFYGTTSLIPTTTIQFNWFGDNLGTPASTTSLVTGQSNLLRCHTDPNNVSGTFAFRWAQAVSSANATIVDGTNASEASKLILTRLH